jgi:hypothetical protein
MITKTMKTSLFVLAGIGMLMLNGCSADCQRFRIPGCEWNRPFRICFNKRTSTEAATSSFIIDEQQKGDYIKQDFDFDTPTPAPSPKIWGEAYA